MINKNKIEWLEKTYNLNMFEDIFFSTNNQVTFLVNTDMHPLMINVLTGDISSLSLPNTNTFPASDIKKYIEPNNMLAEVEGKNDFIEKTIAKFNNFEKKLYLHIPIKREKTPIWLYVGFERIYKNGHNFVFGKILRIFEETPNEIVLYQKTYQDPMTRLFTRETLKMHMNYMIKTTNSYFLYFDIDRFKRINDVYGHQTGDQFLVDLANYFISKWEYNVIYYRLGGDEFCIYCYDHTKEEIEERVKQLIHDIENLNEISKKLGVSTSVGIVEITKDNLDYHNLLNLGDNTMYESKAKGKGNYTFYNKK